MKNLSLMTGLVASIFGAVGCGSQDMANFKRVADVQTTAVSTFNGASVKDVAVNTSDLVQKGNSDMSFNFTNGVTTHKITLSAQDAKPKTGNVRFTSDKEPNYEMVLKCNDDQCDSYFAKLNKKEANGTVSSVNIKHSVYAKLKGEIASGTTPAAPSLTHAFTLGDFANSKVFVQHIDNGDTDFAVQIKGTDPAKTGSTLSGKVGFNTEFSWVSLEGAGSTKANVTYKETTGEFEIHLNDGTGTVIHISQI